MLPPPPDRRVAVLLACWAALAGLPAARAGQEPGPIGDRGPAARQPRPFAGALAQALAPGEGNLVVSPLSIAEALQLARAGARGATAAEFDAVLGPGGVAAPAAGAPDAPKDGAEGRPTFRLAEGVWVDRDLPLEPDYRREVTGPLGAALERVDFRGDPDAAAAEINRWVARTTEGKIPSLFAKGQIRPTTRFALVSALYFRGAWASPFEGYLTEDAPFTTAEGRDVSVPLMRQVGQFAYAEDDVAQFLKLPYRGGRFAMVLALPRPGRSLDDCEGPLLDLIGSEAVAARLGRESVDVRLPRFEVRGRFELSEALRGLGIRRAFDPERADFGGMTGSPEPLALSTVVHEAYLRVDEAGSEAAAATGAAAEITGAQRYESPKSFRADRPFLCAIAAEPGPDILVLVRLAAPGP